MMLLHLAASRNVVWAICDEGTNACQVLDMLMQVNIDHPELAADMMALLFEEVPVSGPPIDDPRRAKRLFPEYLYELKSDRRVGEKHAGLRVIFFFDGPSVIVCTNAFYKGRFFRDESRTPPEEKDRAVAAHSRYVDAKRHGELIFESVESNHE
jgi:hypothetical protein